MMRKLSIIYRVCDSVDMLHAVPNSAETTEKNNYSARYYDVPKHVLIRKCLRTVAQNLAELSKLDGAAKICWEFLCVYDNCSNETLSFIRELLPETKFIKCRGNGGNANSFVTCVEEATNIIDDETIVFLLEDDYLFLTTDGLLKTISALDELSMQKKQRVAIFTDDYPDRYDENGGKTDSEVRVTTVGHFLRIDSCTCSFCAYAGTMKKNKKFFLKFGDYPKVLEKESTDLAWKDTPLFSPMPAFTIHCQHKCHVPKYINAELIKNYFKEGF